MRRYLFLFAALLGYVLGHAQTVTLEAAVERAVEESFVVQQAEMSKRLSEAALQQSKLSRYPNIGLRTNGGLQFGLNVDPTTNDLVQQRTGFASISLDAQVPVYQGGRIRHEISQNTSRVAAAEATTEDARQEIALAVAQRYLEALLATEEANGARARVRELSAAADRVERSIELGAAAPIDVFEPRSLLARQQQLVTVATNNIELAKLQLKQLMRMDPSEALSLVRPESIDFESVSLPAESALAIYQSAISREPAIRAAELDAEAAATGIEVARAGYYPTVAAFGNLDTRYSSQAQRLLNGQDSVFEMQTLFVDGNPVEFGSFRPVFGSEPIPFGTQLSDFFGQAVGLSLNVPIFNNGRTKSAVQRAQVELEQSLLNIEQERQNLEIEVQTALQSARAAQAEVAANLRALEAAEQAYAAAQKRVEAGAASAFDLTNAQILLEQAQVALLRSRYQYLFNAKVLDFYLGKPLTLN